ncbi:30S ribosomal protein S3 [candidate division WWE3 bacterium CG10_big_fil_rev_8_21_14_0_10_32_10]|uniref:Small ribosomal subunit protein uS3 n=1 Tax=candidate division WWE3 bacterium CG10_big_fil_rev_8_21_14_0_10_32_10 TaxID=1975090 RepID=A0A2H0RCB2_UNCKA|nr:MAG: 30S ribosomal protein S3 [candidate division WWE3 bacterium CG10_big_fil_rev_8_21_14_0_10_32_10]
MGNKINTIGFRIGITKDWKSNWFASGKDYGKNVIEDNKIRNFLRKRLSNASLEEIIIERSINEITIILKVARPGFVIGRGGAGVTLLKEELSKYTKDKISLNVEEVKKPETSAVLVADSITNQIERRIHYKRAVLSSISKARDNGVKGIKIIISGVLSGANTISRSEEYKEGSIPQTTLKADIDYGEKPAVTTYGVIGVRVWIYK